MQLKFDWLIVLENLRRGIMVTDVTLEGPAGPRIIYVNNTWLKMTGYERADPSKRAKPGSDFDLRVGVRSFDGPILAADQANIDSWIAATGRKMQDWHYSCWPADRTQASCA